ncbi:MAG: LptF/LptG family permease [Candidatus Omnitrophica bacterium]|nr:LptF/LptG family permease [Candidatus Omnitrophota bacterium]
MEVKLKSRYVIGEFFINFFFSMAVFTFVFSLEAAFGIIEFLVKGTFSPLLVLGVFFLSLLSAFVYIIPLTFLYASTSLFSRMSSDRETLVFSASGVNIRKLVNLLLLFAGISSVFLLVFNLYILPEASYKNRDMIYSLRFRNPLSLLQEKSVTSDIPGINLYIEKISRGYGIKNISITYNEGELTNFLKAESGTVKYEAAENLLVFSLRNGFVIIYDSVQTVSRLNFVNYRFVHRLPEGFGGSRPRTRIADMRLSALIAKGGIREKVEINKRIVFSVIPAIFVLLGAAIGIKLKQQSKMLHIGLGGGITLIFLQLAVLGEMISYKSGTPVFAWLPVALFLLAGIFLK